MTTVLLIIQLMISIVLIGLILIQRSEGGALGIGGGGGGGGVMSGRSSANAVTKATTILGTAFIINCLLLSVAFSMETQGQGILDVDNAETGLLNEADSAKDNFPSGDETPADEMAPAVTPEEPQSDDTQTPQ